MSNYSTYIDFRRNAEKAGAYKDHKKNVWRLKGLASESYTCLLELCREHNIKGDRVDPPKGRSFNAIKKAHLKFGPVRPNDSFDYAKRAIQYMLLMRGIEKPFDWSPSDPKRFTKWEKIGKENRIRYVDMNFQNWPPNYRTKEVYQPDWQEVPHWDFVAKITKES